MVWSWQGFLNAWQEPIPPAATCIECDGRGSWNDVFTGTKRPCWLCRGTGVTSPPVLWVERCSCENGKVTILEFEHMQMDCPECQGAGKFITRSPWDPPSRADRMKTWLGHGDLS